MRENRTEEDAKYLNLHMQHIPKTLLECASCSVLLLLKERCSEGARNFQ